MRLFDGVDIGLCLLDNHFCVVELNAHMAAFQSRSCEESIGRPFETFFPDCSARISQLLQQTVESGTPVLHEHLSSLIQSKSSAKRSFDFSFSPIRDDEGSITGISCVVREITDEDQTQQALQRSEEKYRILVESSPYCIHQIDRTGQIISMNRAGLKMVSLESECDIVGIDYLSAVCDVDRPRIADFMQDAFNGVMCEFEFVGSNGVDFRSNFVPIVDANQKVQRLLGITQDISDQRQSEEERIALQAQLNHAQKMESIGRLAGGVAHDFNNMLCVILGNADLAQDSLTPDQPARECLTEIQYAAERSASLTHQLLAFARKQSISPKVLDLNNTVSGMLKMLDRVIGEDVSLDWVPLKNLWQVKLDPGQIDQILANLCINAKDATEGVGEIKIQTGNVHIDSAMADLSLDAVPGDYVTLTVIDHGCGMDEYTQKNLFEPFFTTKSAERGTGLGLATVYGIVRQNGGFIGVTSEKASGSKFEVFLPRHLGVGETTKKVSSSKNLTNCGESILVVEDEPHLLALASNILTAQGYAVSSTTSPADGLRIIEENTCSFDLVITDVVMPEMSGWELTEHLTTTCPKLNVMYMSGYSEDSIENRPKDSFFIQKPFKQEEFIAVVRQALDASVD
ncbi:MAG: two-component system cell cycle sensor histidine kinase/response regulator CckA [Planctomycetota bacterium]|jgi:two-component system cell cycle sensor histidine kinase/response regulator CckA